MGSGAENIYTLPPPAVLPLGEAAPRTPRRRPGPPEGRGEPKHRDPRPGLSVEQTAWGGSPLPLPSALGQGGGSTRGGAAPKLGVLGGGGGGGPAACPAAHPAPRLGAGRARRCPTAAACHGSGTHTAREELLPGTPGAGRGVTDRVLGRAQSKAKERKLPTPSIHLLKSA